MRPTLRRFQMLNQEQPRESTGWRFSHPVSVAVHCVALWVLFRSGPEPIFVKPSSIQQGDRGTATLVYLAPRGPQQTIASASRKGALVFLKAARAKQQNERSFRPQPAEEPQITETVDAKAGSPFGSVAEGATTGADVRPAIPTLFRDPANLRSS